MYKTNTNKNLNRGEISKIFIKLDLTNDIPNMFQNLVSDNAKALAI